MWVEHVDFPCTVRDGWLLADVDSCSDCIDNFIERLRCCKEKLICWSRVAFPNHKKKN